MPISTELIAAIEAGRHIADLDFNIDAMIAQFRTDHFYALGLGSAADPVRTLLTEMPTTRVQRKKVKSKENSRPGLPPQFINTPKANYLTEIADMKDVDWHHRAFIIKRGVDRLTIRMAKEMIANGIIDAPEESAFFDVQSFRRFFARGTVKAKTQRIGSHFDGDSFMTAILQSDDSLAGEPQPGLIKPAPGDAIVMTAGLKLEKLSNGLIRASQHLVWQNDPSVPRYMMGFRPISGGDLLDLFAEHRAAITTSLPGPTPR